MRENRKLYENVVIEITVKQPVGPDTNFDETDDFRLRTITAHSVRDRIQEEIQLLADELTGALVSTKVVRVWKEDRE